MSKSWPAERVSVKLPETMVIFKKKLNTSSKNNHFSSKRSQVVFLFSKSLQNTQSLLYKNPNNILTMNNSKG
jgi:hypothetical protein